MKAEIFKGKDGQHYWHIKAKNGEIVCQGEGYTKRYSARRGLWRFMMNVQYVEMPK